MSPSVSTTSALFDHAADHRSFQSSADMFAVTAVEFTVEGTANILVNKCIPLRGCPRTILSDHGLQFCSKLSQSVYRLLGVHKLATSSYHPNVNGGIERVTTPGPNAGYGRQRATRRLGFATSSHRVRSQQFGQRGDGFGAE